MDYYFIRTTEIINYYQKSNSLSQSYDLPSKIIMIFGNRLSKNHFKYPLA